MKVRDIKKIIENYGKKLDNVYATYMDIRHNEIVKRELQEARNNYKTAVMACIDYDFMIENFGKEEAVLLIEDQLIALADDFKTLKESLVLDDNTSLEEINHKISIVRNRLLVYSMMVNIIKELSEQELQKFHDYVGKLNDKILADHQKLEEEKADKIYKKIHDEITRSHNIHDDDKLSTYRVALLDGFKHKRSDYYGGTFDTKTMAYFSGEYVDKDLYEEIMGDTYLLSLEKINSLYALSHNKGVKRTK